MKKFILVACCTIATLAIKLDNVRATQRSSRASDTTSIIGNDFSLISHPNDIVIIILMKVRVFDSQYAHKFHGQLGGIRRQLEALRRDPSVIKQLASKVRKTERVVSQAFTQAINIIKNIEGLIQKLLQTKNQLSSVLGLKMNLANTSTVPDLVGILRMLSDSVIPEFQGIIRRFDKVPGSTQDQQVLNSYDQLKNLLVEYSSLLTQLNNSIKSLVNACIKTGININRAFYGITLQELILGNSSTGGTQGTRSVPTRNSVRVEQIDEEDDLKEQDQMDDDEYSSPTNRSGNLNYNGNSRTQMGRQNSMNNGRFPRR